MDLSAAGKGKPFVLLHSLLLGSAGFAMLRQGLSGEKRVLTPDLPGYGLTAKSDASIEEVARTLASSLDEHGVQGPIDLLGNGYGGFVALSFAQQFPERLDHLILMDCAAYFPPPGKEAVRRMQTLVREGGMEVVVPTAIERLFPPAFVLSAPAAVESARQGLLNMDPDAFACTCQNLIEVDLRPGLAAMTTKTLVIVGLEDKATPAILAREVASSVTGAKIEELPECGHAPQVQMPERVIEILQRFLAL